MKHKELESQWNPGQTSRLVFQDAPEVPEIKTAPAEEGVSELNFDKVQNAGHDVIAQSAASVTQLSEQAETTDETKTMLQGTLKDVVDEYNSSERDIGPEEFKTMVAIAVGKLSGEAQTSRRYEFDFEKREGGSFKITCESFVDANGRPGWKTDVQ